MDDGQVLVLYQSGKEKGQLVPSFGVGGMGRDDEGRSRVKKTAVLGEEWGSKRGVLPPGPLAPSRHHLLCMEVFFITGPPDGLEKDLDNLKTLEDVLSASRERKLAVLVTLSPRWKWSARAGYAGEDAGPILASGLFSRRCSRRLWQKARLA